VDIGEWERKRERKKNKEESFGATLDLESRWCPRKRWWIELRPLWTRDRIRILLLWLEPTRWGTNVSEIESERLRFEFLRKEIVALASTIERIQAYITAGADMIFAGTNGVIRAG